MCDMTSMGDSHVLLVACCYIACGEKLYYGYKLHEHTDPTCHLLYPNPNSSDLTSSKRGLVKYSSATQEIVMIEIVKCLVK